MPASIFFQQLKRSLYWRISALLLSIFVLLGIAYIVLTITLAQKYSDETTQKLHAHVAAHMLKHVKPFSGSKVNEESLTTIMNSMMAVNPNLEVYVLDTEGKILSYVILHKKVGVDKVSIGPIKKFLATHGRELVYGDDPRNPGKLKIFSATEVREDGKLLGYVYMVLASEEYENIALALRESYFLKMGVWTFLLTLVAAFAIGLFALRLLMRSLRETVTTVKEFAKGNMEPRIKINSSGEFADFSQTINSMADTLVQNMNDLKEVDKLRRDLIANISHDIRTPLSIIHGYIETISMKEDQLTQEKRHEYLGTALRNTERLKRLVDDLFELSKLESRQIKPKLEEFLISDLIADLTNKYHLSVQEKNIKWMTEMSPQSPVALADIALIDRVLQNLLDNAINHCPEHGVIRIETRVEAGKLFISVFNSGKGISPEETSKIFDRYYKSPEGRSQGTGLGLAIVKNILDIHGSHITVHSEITKGTTFTFDLNLSKNKHPN